MKLKEVLDEVSYVFGIATTDSQVESLREAITKAWTEGYRESQADMINLHRHEEID